MSLTQRLYFGNAVLRYNSPVSRKFRWLYMEVYSYFSLKLPKWSIDMWKHYLDAQSFNLWQSSSKLDSVFINLNFPSRGGHSQTVVNTTAKKFWKTWTVTHLLKVRQNSGCIAGNDGWQFLYQKGHDNMLVDRGEEILFNIVIDSTGARFGGLSCVRLRCQLSRFV